MAESHAYDVFLSHSSKDKPIVRPLAERLRADGIKVWFDEWEIKPGDSIPARIDDGLENSRILILCMSASAFGSDWSQLESYTFRFRDPLNKSRRFIPVRLDDAPIKGSLAQFLYLDWRSRDFDQQYPKLLESCRPSMSSSPPPTQSSSPPSTQPARPKFEHRVLSLGHIVTVRSVAFSPDNTRALSGSDDRTVRLWNVASGECIRVLEGHSDGVRSVSWSSDGRLALSASYDHSLRLWNVDNGQCIRVLEGHSDGVNSVAWSSDGQLALSASDDHSVRLWNVDNGQCIRVLQGHSKAVNSVAWSSDGRLALSASDDNSVRLWDVNTGQCIRVFKGHTSSVNSVSWSSHEQHALSGSSDSSIRLWDVNTSKCIRTLEGHSDSVLSVAFSSDGRLALSASSDNSVRLWDANTGQCIRTLEGHSDSVLSVAFSSDGRLALSVSRDNSVRLWNVNTGHCIRVLEGHSDNVNTVAWSSDGQLALSASSDNSVRLWNVNTGHCIRVLEGHSDSVNTVAWSSDGQLALSASNDNSVRLWNVDNGLCIRVLKGHFDYVRSVSFSSDGRLALSASSDHTVRLWNVDNGQCIRVLKGHSHRVWSVAWSSDGQLALSASNDNSVRLWNVDNGLCIRVLEGHSDRVWSVAWSSDGRHALSASDDHSVRLWDVASGQCIRVLEGHSAGVNSVAWSSDGGHALSASDDNTVRLWNVDNGQCIRVLEGHSAAVNSVAWSSDGLQAFSSAINGVWRVWDVSDLIAQTSSQSDSPQPLELESRQVQYTNAKVLLVGDSGVGKTGLSNRLALGKFEETASTDGAWATHWPLPHSHNQDDTVREIWLWDFAGQVDYRLVHQLFMNDTSAAVLVFNPQQENPFDGLGHWDRDLHKATEKPFAKLLAAARIDRGGLIISDATMTKFMADRGFRAPLHLTSAKTGEACDTLRDTIIEAIDWSSIETTTSPVLYHRMKQEILKLRDSGHVLLRQSELKQRMEMTLLGERFQIEELNAVVRLLAGPGMIQRLDFGGFILLRPEILSRYAAAVVRKVRAHPQEMGCIREDEMLAGDLDYKDFERLPREDESVVLKALLETFVNRAWCLRQPCDGTSLLTFPSYFRRERKDQPSHPSVLVTYRFDGPTDDVYATLVVRLHHTAAFDSTNLWKSAADFKTKTGAALGFTLTKESEGTSRLEVYFHPDVDYVSRIIFDRYVHDHLKHYDSQVKRLRHYSCVNTKCESFNLRFADQAMIDKALAPNGKGKVFCPDCGKPINLRDPIEQNVESPAAKQQARAMDKQAQAEIDIETSELLALHHTGYIVAEAGQIYHSYTKSDHGIDGEIEFKNDDGKPSGKRLYVQLKSGDSYLKTGQRHDAETFQIKNPAWADYWRQKACPVMLVIRTSDGEIRWMDMTADFRYHAAVGKPTFRIHFKGERLDVMSVRRWRDRLLSDTPASP